MVRADNIIQNAGYIKIVRHIEELETDRIFCHHDMDHFLDVARIMVIMSYEEGLDYERDVMYATALLHDIGRAVQYEEGTPHEEAGAPIAERILSECGFTKEESDMITTAIKEHGNEAVMKAADLSGLLYRADKASRKCYYCNAIDKCHKKKEKLVTSVIY